MIKQWNKIKVLELGPLQVPQPMLIYNPKTVINNIIYCNKGLLLLLLFDSVY